MRDCDFMIGLAQYAEGVEYTNDGETFHMRVTCVRGREAELDAYLKKTCGNGSPAHLRERPVIKDKMADAFALANLLAVYDYRCAEDDTQTWTIYTADSPDGRDIYIFAEKDIFGTSK